MMRLILHPLGLLLTYYLLGDRRIDDVTFINETSRLYVAVSLCSNRSQKTSKYGRNIGNILGCVSCAPFLSLSHFDVINDSLDDQTHGNMESIRYMKNNFKKNKNNNINK